MLFGSRKKPTHRFKPTKASQKEIRPGGEAERALGWTVGEHFTHFAFSLRTIGVIKPKSQPCYKRGNPNIRIVDTAATNCNT